MSSSLVETRIPTYNRPALLRRALRSLQEQTHRNWRAVVLDDGDAGRTRGLIDEIGDPRILHRPNPRRLGAGPNIAQAFSMTPLAGGMFFHVLEDDNLVLPRFMADNLALLATHGVDIVLNNQWIERVSEDLDLWPPEHDDDTTLDCFSEGIWTADDLRVAMMWRLPLSNGGLFWRLGCRSDLTVDDVEDAGQQEWVRCFRLAEDVYFNATPNAIWRPISELYSTEFNFSMFLKEHRLQQTMRRRVLAAMNARGARNMLLSDRFTTPLPLREIGVLRTPGRWPGTSGLGWRRRLALVAKALAIRLFAPPAPRQAIRALGRRPVHAPSRPSAMPAAPLGPIDPDSTRPSGPRSA
ncbi:MAG: glycosyltransferase family 2 protein [Enhydrobacter sp.]|nr:MAG: glycosyltransferase family 2 protein [Enhydrobacter sp.]